NKDHKSTLDWVISKYLTFQKIEQPVVTWQSKTGETHQRVKHFKQMLADHSGKPTVLILDIDPDYPYQNSLFSTLAMAMDDSNMRLSASLAGGTPRNIDCSQFTVFIRFPVKQADLVKSLTPPDKEYDLEGYKSLGSRAQ